MSTHAANPVEALAAGKRFTLAFKNAAEDVPRLITCYGRCCGGELALVLRPDEGRGAFVKVLKDKALASWSKTGDPSDAPREPDIELSPKDAVKRVKVEQMALPRAADITLRGQWKGHLHCAGGTHKVILQRKVASYGTLLVFSDANRWTWKVLRDEKWFSDAHEKWGGSRPTLKAAIQAGLADAMNLLGDACSVRDSRRRAALDSAYAAEHPIQPAKEGKDPIERLKEPAEKPARAGRRRKDGSAAPTLTLVPSPLDAPLDLPAPPGKRAELRDAAQALADEAAAYRRIQDAGWVRAYVAEADLWYGALLDAGLDDVVTRIQDWFDAPTTPALELVEGLRAEVEARDLTPADQRRADQAIDQLERELGRGPALLTRARWLIRYAANAVSSRLCQGREREEASAAIERAAAEYDAIYALLDAGGAFEDPLQEEDPELSEELSRRLRSLGRGIGLAAAKLARSCATGQQTVTALASAKKAAAEKPRGANRDSRHLREVAKADGACPCGGAGEQREHKAKGGGGDAHGRLVIVPIFGVPKTAAELRDHLVAASSSLKAEPSLRLAKKWAKTAVERLEFPIADLKGARDGNGGFVVQLTPAGDPVSAEAQARLAMIREAITLAGVPLRLTVVGEAAPTGEADPPKRRRGRPPKSAATAEPSAPAAGGGAEATAESAADAEKDAVLMDAITRVIQQTLGNGGN